MKWASCFLFCFCYIEKDFAQTKSPWAEVVCVFFFFFLNTIALPLSLCLSGFLGVRRNGKKKTIWAVGGPECTAERGGVGGANPDIKGFELTQQDAGSMRQVEVNKKQTNKDTKENNNSKKKTQIQQKQRTYKL